MSGRRPSLRSSPARCVCSAAGGPAGEAHTRLTCLCPVVVQACFRMLSEELFKIKCARSPFVDGDAEGDADGCSTMGGAATPRKAVPCAAAFSSVTAHAAKQPAGVV